MSQAIFAHDTEVALAAAAALVNTGRHDPDELASVADLDRFVREWRFTGGRRRDPIELEGVRTLRPQLARIWELDADAAAATVNELLRLGGALPQLVRHDGWDYHLHATPPEAPLHTRMMVEAAMAVVDVVRLGELARLQICAASDCDDVYVDLSKNRSRRFCTTTCANRSNASAFRARRAVEQDRVAGGGTLRPG